ncbi:transposase domain-containing protein [Saccharothrix syringae]|uniref:transposase domain-containing protein n=1 Tax=Saccharothrix syringae TaxID=103733 RepID=UPI001D172927|nr:transposase domain-containing protein [Saccharothrix syringae]
MAAGRFAPGYLGELTRVVPFDLVDAILAETRTVQWRLRDLPSRVGVYFLLAMCLFPEVGYRLVWQKLIGGLTGLIAWSPSTAAARSRSPTPPATGPGSIPRATAATPDGAMTLVETDYTRRLLHLLTPDMVVLWDKGFDSNAFLADVHATGARILGTAARQPAHPRPGPSRRRLPPLDDRRRAGPRSPGPTGWSRA